MKKTLYAIISTSLFVPLVAFAEGSVTGGIRSLGGLINDITTNIFAALITLFGTAAVAAFFFGLAMFILASRKGVEADITKGKQFMGWGLLALFILFSVWGIIRFGQGIFGFNTTSIDIPRVNIGGTSNTSNTNTNTALPPGTTAVAGADCTGPAQCGSALVCRGYKCTANAPGGVDAPCDNASHCTSGLTCTNFKCSQAGTAPTTCPTTETYGNSCSCGGYTGRVGTDGQCYVGGSRGGSSGSDPSPSCNILSRDACTSPCIWRNAGTGGYCDYN